MPDKPEEKRPPQAEGATVPQFDVRNCVVCGHPMQYGQCKYRCRKCGTMIDCSDAF